MIPAHYKRISKILNLLNLGLPLQLKNKKNQDLVYSELFFVIKLTILAIFISLIFVITAIPSKTLILKNL